MCEPEWDSPTNSPVSYISRPCCSLASNYPEMPLTSHKTKRDGEGWSRRSAHVQALLSVGMWKTRSDRAHLAAVNSRLNDFFDGILPRCTEHRQLSEYAIRVWQLLSVASNTHFTTPWAEKVVTAIDIYGTGCYYNTCVWLHLMPSTAQKLLSLLCCSSKCHATTFFGIFSSKNCKVLHLFAWIEK